MFKSNNNTLLLSTAMINVKQVHNLVSRHRFYYNLIVNIIHLPLNYNNNYLHTRNYYLFKNNEQYKLSSI